MSTEAPTSALMVPIHLDALVLENDESVLHAMADFSKLPYYDGDWDGGRGANFNADVPYISESIVALPFRDKNLRLGRGVHLHWALPDSLTRGVRTEKGLVFPVVPDRWLVTRTDLDGKIEKQWIVESDYLHPEGDPEGDPPADTVSFPLPPKEGKWQPYRYLGRKWVVSGGKPADVPPDAEYLNALADVSEDPKTNWHHIVSMGLIPSVCKYQ